MLEAIPGFICTLITVVKHSGSRQNNLHKASSGLARSYLGSIFLKALGKCDASQLFVFPAALLEAIRLLRRGMLEDGTGALESRLVGEAGTNCTVGEMLVVGSGPEGTSLSLSLESDEESVVLLSPSKGV